MEAKSTILRLAWYLARKRHAKFRWGQEDCNTLVVEMHDYVHETNIAHHVKGKYDSEFGALKFSQKLKAPEFLAKIGYSKRLRPTTGDVLLVEDRGIWRAHICFEQKVYSMDPERNLVFAKKSSLESAEVWRYTG